MDRRSFFGGLVALAVAPVAAVKGMRKPETVRSVNVKFPPLDEHDVERTYFYTHNNGRWEKVGWFEPLSLNYGPHYRPETWVTITPT